jgi:Holliday junction resolvase RusA-like endonuclease
VIDPPFAVPPDIVLFLPPPMSVNRTRKIDWRQQKSVKDWWRNAENMLLMQKRKLPPPITGRYELIVTLHEGLRMDADNGLKIICDAMRRFGLVTDDSPKYLRRLTVEFGDVSGCRVTIRPMA